MLSQKKCEVHHSSFRREKQAGGVARKTLFLHAQQCEHEEKGSAVTGPRNHPSLGGNGDDGTIIFKTGSYKEL